MSRDTKLTWKDVKRLTVGHLQHETETSWYILVSIADFVLSYLLFSGGTGDGKVAYEANGVARWFLDHYGLIKGLLTYKVVLVIFVCVVVQTISLKKPMWGRGLLWLAIAVTGYVVFFSLKLLLGVR